GDIPPHVDRVVSKPPKLRELREALARCADARVASSSRAYLRINSIVAPWPWALVSKPVHGLEACGKLIVAYAGAGRSCKERRVFDEDAGVRFITAHLSAQFDGFCWQVCERQRCLFPLLNDAGAVAVLVVEVLGAHREPPLIVGLIIDVARRAIPLRLD